MSDMSFVRYSDGNTSDVPSKALVELELDFQPLRTATRQFDFGELDLTAMHGSRKLHYVYDGTSSSLMSFRKVNAQMRRPLSEAFLPVIGETHGISKSKLHFQNVKNIEARPLMTYNDTRSLASIAVFWFDLLGVAFLALGVVAIISFWGSVSGEVSRPPVFFLALAVISLLLFSSLRKASRQLRRNLSRS